jgi:hypothetical protein
MLDFIKGVTNCTECINCNLCKNWNGNNKCRGHILREFNKEG